MGARCLHVRRGLWTSAALLGLWMGNAYAAEDRQRSPVAEKPETEWLIPPGQEAKVIQLLAPYYEAPAAPTIRRVQIDNVVVRATLERSSGDAVVLELHHAASSTVVELPTGITVLASVSGADLQVAGPTALAGLPDVVAVAKAIVGNRMTHGVALWRENPRKRERVLEIARHSAEPPPPITHRGLLSAEAQEMATFAALGVGLLAGLAWGWRRRGR